MGFNVRFFGIFIMPFLFAKMTQAQALNDSLYVRELTRIMVENYTNAQYSQAPIYNGKVYRPDLKLDGDGHTLFYDSRYTTGTVIYNGLTYNNIMLLYDLVLDQLVLLNLDKAGGIMIPSDHIDEFSFT